MKVIPDLFPGGVQRAFTMSYDDGQIYDRKLVKILNNSQIKATFHLNSGILGGDIFVEREEVKELYKGNEVAAHGVTHPFITQISEPDLIQEILEDRRNLEKICGYPVRGFSYPYGRYTGKAEEIVKYCGIEYSRTVNSTGDFYVPENFMEWNPTCHHDDENLFHMWEKFMQPDFQRPMLFYVWGHSFEFERNNNWTRIEEFCSQAGGQDEVWYATNIEIKEYVSAVRGLVYSVDMNNIYNPSCKDVWVSVEGEAIKIPAGGYVNVK